MIDLDRTSKTPLYVQIVHQLRTMILDGSLAEGTRLLPERKLAALLNVNRSTVVNAYRELAAEGLVEARVGQGTTVCRSPARDEEAASALPFRPLNWDEYFAPRVRGQDNASLRDLTSLLARPDVISFAAGIPAPDLYPLDDFRQVVGQMLHSQGLALLQPCPTEGFYPLRRTVAERMEARGATVKAENVLIVTGSQQGLDLLARLFLESGNTVVVEAPTYLGALRAFRAAGVRLLAVPVDEDGMRLDILENILLRHRPKLIYTLPTFQNPSGLTMSLDRRLRLLDAARRHRVPIVEDDPYGELYYAEPPPSPLLALDRGAQVIYLSTFSKTLFPGLRLGWVAAPRPVVKRLSQIKQLADLHCNTLMQGVISEFCRRGLLDRHLAQARDAYRRRRDVTLAALASSGLTWREPQGGFNLWCRLPAGLRARDLLFEAGRHNVAFAPGELFCSDGGGEEELRLNFSCVTEDEIEEGARRLKAALAALRRRKGKIQPEQVDFAAQPIV